MKQLNLKLTCLLFFIAINFFFVYSIDAQTDQLLYAFQEWDGVSQDTKISTIRSINDDGTNDHEIVSKGAYNTTDPKINPNGKWLYFQSNDLSNTLQVYACQPDGSKVRNISAIAQNVYGNSWNKAYGLSTSGDGSKIVYTVYNTTSGTGRNIVADADGSSPVLIQNTLGYSYMGALNHNGSILLFANQAAEYHIYSSNIDNTGLTILSDVNGSTIPQFNLAENRFVYRQQEGSNFFFYSKNLAGLDPVQLSTNSTRDFKWNVSDEHGSSENPSFSPDRKKMVYTASIMTEGILIDQVFVLNFENNSTTQLTVRTHNCARASFSPDGRQICFVSFESANSPKSDGTGEEPPQLFVMNVDGSGKRQLTHYTNKGVYFAVWKHATINNVTQLLTLFN